MYFVSGVSSISHQPAFRNPGFHRTIRPLEPGSELVTPNFRDFIDPGLVRRMGKLLRISVSSAKDALIQADLDQPDAIIVGTGLGCLQDTEKFLNNFLTIEGLLPPTAFIQSTHNTIAGQISLSLGNHSYNMTHTQNTVSFEHALLDGMLSLDEGKTHVLVGGADEYIEILDQIAPHFDISTHKLASAAVFLVLSGRKSGKTLAGVKDVEVIGNVSNPSQRIASFLDRNSLDLSKIDLVLEAGINDLHNEPILSQAGNAKQYIPLSGLFPTASAFAFHYAVDFIQFSGGGHKKSLIVNHLNPTNLGLTLLQSVEA